MEVIKKKLSEIKPYERNPRRKHNYEKVASSIKEFGFNQPIVVDKKGIIIAGHSRYEAAKILNLKEVPVVVSSLNPEKAIAYRIADNKTNEYSDWDYPTLHKEFGDLLDMNYDLDNLGFGDKELEDLITYDSSKAKRNEKTRMMDISQLKPHPQNYREHPEDQIDHLVKSIKDFGLYRNVVIAEDNTILAGHGIVIACNRLEIKSVPTLKLPIKYDSIEALKLLTADNEVSHLSENDDRKLSEILKEIMEANDLLGTGYDEMMLANLLFVTRPASEIKDIDHAAEWLGMPDVDGGTIPTKIVVSFETEDDRREFALKLNIPLTDKTKSTWYPYKENDDIKNVRFEDEE